MAAAAAPDSPALGADAPAPGSRIAVALALGVPLALFAGAGGVLSHGYVEWDDASFLLSNPLVTAWADQPLVDRLLTPTSGYAIPVTVAFQALLHALGGGDALLFHVGSLLAHLAAVGATFALARGLGAGPWAACLGALTFGLHPAVAEPVAWATGTKDTLTGALALGGTAALVHGLRRVRGGLDPGRLFLAAGVLGVLAALAKPTATLAGLAWVLALLVARDRQRPADETVPQGAWGATFAASAVGLLSVGLSRIQHDTLLLGGDTSHLEHSLDQVPLALGHQLSHVLWPVDLHPRYGLDRTAGFDDPFAWLGLAAAVVAVAGLAWAIRGRRLAPTLAIALAGAAYLPVSNLLPFSRFVGDSYLYVPLAALAGGLLAPSLGRASALGGAVRAVSVGGTAALVVGLGLLAAAQAGRWAGDRALWEPTIAAYPTWDEPKILLAQGLRFAGDGEGAVEAWGSLLVDDPGRPERRPFLSAYAIALAEVGRLDDAECVFAEDVMRDPPSPSALGNLAAFLAQHPDHGVTLPVPAAVAVQWAGRHRSQLPWPDGWWPVLGQRMQQLRSLGPPADRPTPWPPGTCRALGGQGPSGSTAPSPRPI